MEYISRHMESRILELSKSYSAILLTGPRQAGKTTMLRELAEKENIRRRYVTLDDLTERDMAKNDPALFLQLHQPPVLIDEVQYAPELFTYIKIYIDEHHNPGDFWMTGSQIFRLMRGVQESLAGRVALLHMSPMSQREIIGAPCVRSEYLLLLLPLHLCGTGCAGSLRKCGCPEIQPFRHRRCRPLLPTVEL